MENSGAKGRPDNVELRRKGLCRHVLLGCALELTINSTKTNPGPLGENTCLTCRYFLTFSTETILCQHPYISSAVMFGRGRFQNGALIEVKTDYEFNPSNLDRLEAFRASIWCCFNIL